MVIRNTHSFILLFIVLCVGCDNDEPEMHREFVAFGNINFTPFYWHNGRANRLEGYTVYITDGAVLGDDIYALGYVNDGETYAGAVYWKNGKMFKLSTEGRNDVPTAIAISGDDIYIAGFEDKGLESIALYWKNGERIVVSGEDGFARPTDIAVSGSDVHLVGWAQNRVDYPDSTLAAYWKNGVRIKLNAESRTEQINSIVISGSDVYFTGETYNRPDFYPTARIWKNGEPTDFIGRGDRSYGKRIVTIGADVYVAGEDGTNAVYWKNGMVTPLETGAISDSDVNGMVTVDGHLIISGTNYQDGHTYQGSFVWIDGETVFPFSGLDPAFVINCIAANP
ncbi:MAG: hypothetical protein ABIS36_01915 [Chryseolinea sp.]